MDMGITSAGWHSSYGHSRQSTASEQKEVPASAGKNRGRPVIRPGHAVSRSAPHRVETLLYHPAILPAPVPLHRSTAPHLHTMALGRPT